MIKLSVLMAVFLIAAGIASTGVSTSFAQNNALSQSGNSEAEQSIEQSQDSKQGAQCVSGDFTLLSCNNIAAQAQSNGEIPTPGPSPGPGSDKVTLCHKTGSETNPEVTISVSPNAVPAHIAHGDELGACKITG